LFYKGHRPFIIIALKDFYGAQSIISGCLLSVNLLLILYNPQGSMAVITILGDSYQIRVFLENQFCDPFLAKK
jgi:hypothetical protein